MGEKEIEEIVFSKCPVCKKGKVQRIREKKLFGLSSSEIIECDQCSAIFDEGEEWLGNRIFTLDLSNSKQKSDYEGEPLTEREWKDGISDFDYCTENNTLIKLNTEGLGIILNSNEISHHYDGARLMEERAVRRSYGGAVRVAKGVYIGSSQGESHGELREIDSGGLLLTNQRLIFNGQLRNVEYKLDRIVSVEEHEGAIEIGASNRKKVQVFTVDDPEKWATYIKIAIQNYQKNRKNEGRKPRQK